MVWIVLMGLVLAYANGANDNFKGVATLYGSGTTSYRKALAWATLTTGLGSLTALVLAKGLLAAFSGKGLVAAEIIQNPMFPTSVALAAGFTVLAATKWGFPISTTHALIGALVGAGWVFPGSSLNLGTLVQSFLFPLLASPLLAVVLAALLYPPLRFLRKRFKVDQETCVCVGNEVVGVVPGHQNLEQAMVALKLPTLRLSDQASCQLQYQGRFMGIRAKSVVDAAHFISAGAVSFARGLNDTPKIAALLLFGSLFSPNWALLAVAIVMAMGGVLQAKNVAETMAHKVTELNPGQGFTANLVTSLLVIGASKWGVPVSTTHVSCGSLFGIGAVSGQAHWRTIGHILLAWLITLPLAGLLAMTAVQIQVWVR